MRRYLWLACLLAASTVQADTSTLRVGSQVLVVGDSAAKVIDLLGKPTHKTHEKGSSRSRTGSGKKGRKTGATNTSGEQGQYRHGNRFVTVIVVDGRVSAIRDGGR
jgi:hypothetical protein